MLPWLVFALLIGFMVFMRFAGKGSSEEAHALVAQGARLLDVRTPQEFTAGHIQGAVNIPIAELERRLSEVGPKETPVVVYCASGARSAAATRLLRGKGWQQVMDLGGMSRW